MSAHDGRITVLAAADKFKGSLSAAEVVHWISCDLTAGVNHDLVSCAQLP